MYRADGLGDHPPPPAERPAYRKMALDWLTADLAAFRKLAAADPATVQRFMQHWLKDGDLASVRDPGKVGRLQALERADWARFWTEVRALCDRTAPKAGPVRQVK